MKAKLKKIPMYAFLLVFTFFCLYPLLWLFISSLKTNNELFESPWSLPDSWLFSNYITAFKMGNIGRYFINSVIVTLTSVTLSVLLGAMAAYGVTRLKWRFASYAAAVLSMGLMVPAYGSIIPLFSMFLKLNILNTYLAVIIPHVTFAIPMVIVIQSGFFASVPKELEEAAVIDGCGLIKAFYKIIMPISISPIVTAAVVCMINIWNDLLFSQVFLTDAAKMTLPVGLTAFQGRYSTDYVNMFAAIVIAVLPVMAAYIVLHNRIIEGMSAGAVKG